MLKMSESKIVNSTVGEARILQSPSNGNNRIGKISESAKLGRGTTPRLRGMVTSLPPVGGFSRLGKVRDAIAAGSRTALAI